MRIPLIDWNPVHHLCDLPPSPCTYVYLPHRLSPFHPSSSSQEGEDFRRLLEPNPFPRTVPGLLANAGKPWQITVGNGVDGWMTSSGLGVTSSHGLEKGFEKVLDEGSSRVIETNWLFWLWLTTRIAGKICLNIAFYWNPAWSSSFSKLLQQHLDDPQRLVSLFNCLRGSGIIFSPPFFNLCCVRYWQVIYYKVIYFLI